jgi:plastocyanin
MEAFQVMKRMALVPLALTLALGLAVTGCGSSKKKSTAAPPSTSATPTTNATPTKTPSGGGSNLKLSADPSGSFKFDKTALSAKAGKVTITMDNPSSTMHGIAVKGSGVSQIGPTVGQGATSTVSATLKPGTYEFYCPVPGHEAGGMKGTLTVK